MTNSLRQSLNSEPVAIKAIFKQARTDISGGWIITFEVDEKSSPQVMELSKMRNEVLYIVCALASQLNDEGST